MHISFRRMHHGHQNPPRRLLLANHGGKLRHFRQKVHTLPKTWQPHLPKARTTSFHTLPMAFHQMGNRHPRPLSPGKGQVKFLIVAIDYFTKWIEAKPLATITTQQV